mmetsp:Transcript_85599/g.184784  ORF Transcript_85599/g.184784 Transcript_85599/m.184784 type:complete len:97 (-) Transcript_85599:576-866(-)
MPARWAESQAAVITGVSAKVAALGDAALSLAAAAAPAESKAAAPPLRGVAAAAVLSGAAPTPRLRTRRTAGARSRDVLLERCAWMRSFERARARIA